MAKKKATKKTTKNTRTSTSALVDKLRAKRDTLKGGGGASHNWMKFDKGANKFRLVIPPEGPVLQFYKRHRGTRAGGGFAARVDLRWLLSDQEAVAEMKKREKITNQDIEFINNYGDPYDILFHALNAIDKADAFKKAGIGQKRAMMVILKDEQIGILDMSMGFGESIVDLLGANEIILDPEEGMPLTVKATGEGMKRRYSSPVPVMSEQGPIDLDDGDELVIPNLYDVLAGNVLSYPEKVKFLMRSHKPLVEEAGLDITDFGLVDEGVVDDEDDSFNYGANAEEDNEEEEDDNEDEEDIDDEDDDDSDE